MRITNCLDNINNYLITSLKNNEFTKAIVQNRKIIAIVAVIFSALAIVSFAIYYLRNKIRPQSSNTQVKPISQENSLGNGIEAKDHSNNQEQIVQIPEDASKKFLTDPEKKDPSNAATNGGKVLQSTVPGTPPTIEGIKFIIPVNWYESTDGYVNMGSCEIPAEKFLNRPSHDIHYSDYDVIHHLFVNETGKDGFRLLSFIYSSCFHTTESHEEILARLEKIRNEHIPDAEKYPPQSEAYIHSYVELVRNLINIHSILTGPTGKSKTKIYWNEVAENVIIPQFFKEETKGICFKFIEGEADEPIFQNEQIDFNQHLQFIGIDFKAFFKAFKDLFNESFEDSELIVYGKFIDFMKNDLISIFNYKDLKGDAFVDTYFSYNCFKLFFELRKNNQSLVNSNFKGMTKDEQMKAILSLYKVIRERSISNDEYDELEAMFPLEFKQNIGIHPHYAHDVNIEPVSSEQVQLDCWVEALLEVISKSDIIPKLTYGEILKGKQPRAVTLSSPFLENLIVEPDFHDLTALFDACFHTTESHEEILDRIVAIQKARNSGEDISLFGESYDNLFENLLSIHQVLNHDHAKTLKKIYWSERAEKLLLPNLLDSKYEDIKYFLTLEPVSGEISAPIEQQVLTEQLQLLYFGIDCDDIQICFNRLLESIYGDNFIHDLMETLEKENNHKMLQDLELCKQVNDMVFNSCLLNHLILNSNNETIKIKPLKEKIDLIKEVLAD